MTLRALAAALITWLPLAVIMLVAPGSGEGATSGFFHDIATHVRLLLVMPLLILAEIGIGARTRMVADDFQQSGLIPDADQPRFASIIRTAQKRLNSGLAELLIALLAYVFVGCLILGLTRDGTLSWFEEMGPDGEQLTAGGWWYAAVVPLVAFQFFRWGWRYLVWSWFLHRVAQLDLQIVTTHPDRVGGLSFVNAGHSAFSSVTLAASCIVAAAVGTRILNDGVHLQQYPSVFDQLRGAPGGDRPGPLATFSPRLVRAKRRGLIQYGHLATVYIRMFEDKWLGRAAPKDESLLGSGDIQSLADLGGSFERLDDMRTTPFDKKTALTFAMAAIGPMLPLLLTVIPLSEILQLLLKTLV